MNFFYKIMNIYLIKWKLYKVKKIKIKENKKGNINRKYKKKNKGTIKNREIRKSSHKWASPLGSLRTLGRADDSWRFEWHIGFFGISYTPLNGPFLYADQVGADRAPHTPVWV
jgi:hypothetical protein